MKIIITKNYDEMSSVAADLVEKCINKKPNAILGLATGSTPIGLYKELIKRHNDNKISFKDITSVNLDEYIGLPGDHDQSYRYFMNENLFNHVDIDKTKTFVPNGKAEDLNEEAKNYEKNIDDLGGIDLQILGIGTNGHVGFNEPSSKLELYTHIEDLTESTIHANSRFFDSIDDVPTTAISMGIGSIFKAKEIILLASGENKAKIMQTLKDTLVTPLIPASFLKLHPNVTIIMDEDAASLYNQE